MVVRHGPGLSSGSTIDRGWRPIHQHSRSGWDHHQDVFNSLSRNNLPEFDRAFSSLIQDLSERGLMESTLVVAGTEFGRTPEINVNAVEITGPMPSL